MTSVAEASTQGNARDAVETGVAMSVSSSRAYPVMPEESRVLREISRSMRERAGPRTVPSAKSMERAAGAHSAAGTSSGVAGTPISACTPCNASPKARALA